VNLCGVMNWPADLFHGSKFIRSSRSVKRGSSRRVSALDAGLELIGIPFLFHFFQFHLYRFNAFVKFARQEIIRVRLQKLLQRSQMGSLHRQICWHFYIWRHARPFPVGSSDGIDRIAIGHHDFKALKSDFISYLSEY